MADTPKPAAKTAKVTRWRAKSAEQIAEKDTILPHKKRKVSEIVGLDQAKPKSRAKNVKSQPNEQDKVPQGRKSTFKQEVADSICSRLSKGEPLAQICRDEGMPAVRTVSDWKEAHPAFSADIACARDDGWDYLAAECLAIADETSKDTVYGENGERANTEWISRSKLRIETRLKLLAKWDPKRYGDKIDLNHGGQVENPLAILMSQVSGKTFKPVDE